MKKPGNKVISIYLIWELLHVALLFASPKTPHVNNGETGQEVILYYPTKFFYPFTTGEVQRFSKHFVFDNFDLQFYDFTEFAFYSIAPILIYYAVSYWNKKPNA